MSYKYSDIFNIPKIFKTSPYSIGHKNLQHCSSINIYESDVQLAELIPLQRIIKNKSNDGGMLHDSLKADFTIHIKKST